MQNKTVRANTPLLFTGVTAALLMGEVLIRTVFTGAVPVELGDSSLVIDHSALGYVLNPDSSGIDDHPAPLGYKKYAEIITNHEVFQRN